MFARRAFGSEAVAFLVGFCEIAVGVTSVGAPAVAFGGDYLGEIVTVPPVPVAVVLETSATLTGNLAELADTVVLLLLLSFLSTNVAAVVLRRRPRRASATTRGSPWSCRSSGRCPASG